jgi:nicotinate-nucleotide pyrophosphorylase (carboxylating)
VCRQPGIVCGLAAAPKIVADPDISLDLLASDGDAVDAGQVIARLNGPLSSILDVERMLLNFIAHLSGVATYTSRFVDAVASTKAVICDTRKTIPGLRNLQKYAVRCGGGTLHRLGLFDAALFKDNHLACVDPAELVKRLTYATHFVRAAQDIRFVEVEVDRLDQLQQVLSIEPGLIDIVLLDNMSLDQLRSAVSLRNRVAPQIALEASGGVTLANVAAIARTGVERIAVGAITHSAPALDVGLDVVL